METPLGVCMPVPHRGGSSQPRPGPRALRRSRPAQASRNFAAEAPQAARGREVSPEQFWDLHGAALLALAVALLGDREAALNAVRRAMVDLYTEAVPSEATSSETLRRAAGHVFQRCEGGPTAPMSPAALAAGAHPSVVRLGELAVAQRAAMALCVYGAHTYQLAAARLGLPADVVADLLNAGLRELCRP